MSWKTRLQPASFRGASFFLESHATEGGRNTDSEEQEVIYGKEPPPAHDLGKKRIFYTLEALVIGEDYDRARDALLTALGRGAGTLVHPHLGTLKVQVEEWTCEETVEEGGLARFSLTFSEEGSDAPLTTTELYLLSGAFAASNKAATQSFLSQERDFFAAGQDFVAGLAAGAEAFQDEVNGVVDRVTAGVAAFIDPLASLARAPANLAASVLGGVNTLVATFENARAAFRSLGQVIDRLRGSQPSGDDPAAKAERALHSLFVLGAVGALADQATRADWGNSSDALDAQTAFLSQIDRLLESADAHTDGPLRDLRAGTVRALSQSATGLPALKTIVLEKTLPWLAVAQMLYPDHPNLSDLADAFWQRNIKAAPSPLFMPAGVPLEYVEVAR